MIAKLFVFLVVWSSGLLFAGSVRLINDSPFPLRAVVRGADGSYLGEMLINAGQASSWSDAYGQLQQGSYYGQQPTRSQTPYSITWFCLDGSDFSFCPSTNAGTTVTANNCDGARSCKPPKKQPGQPGQSGPSGPQSNLPDYGPPAAGIQSEQQGIGPPVQGYGPP